MNENSNIVQTAHETAVRTCGGVFVLNSDLRAINQSLDHNSGHEGPSGVIFHEILDYEAVEDDRILDSDTTGRGRTFVMASPATDPSQDILRLMDRVYKSQGFQLCF